MIRRHHEIDAHAFEPDHVAAVLLAYESPCALILEATVDAPGCEHLVARDIGPWLPAAFSQNLSCVVVAAVPVPHQKADQPFVGVVHNLLATGEADARGVHDRQVRRHRAVELDETVIKDSNGVVGYHSLGGCHG